MFIVVVVFIVAAVVAAVAAAVVAVVAAVVAAVVDAVIALLLVAVVAAVAVVDTAFAVVAVVAFVAAATVAAIVAGVFVKKKLLQQPTSAETDSVIDSNNQERFVVNTGIKQASGVVNTKHGCSCFAFVYGHFTSDSNKYQQPTTNNQ